MPQESATPAAERYDARAIERKWQAVWEDEGTWEVPNPGDPGFDPAIPRSYVLEMLPYPSGEPHIGHLKNYTMGDVLAHYRRRAGMRVLHPMGYDAFGLPAENHAIKTGEHPRTSTENSISEFRRQLRSWGVSIDWRREFATNEPRYYRWTQWIFLKLYERGLAYRKRAPVKWCPHDQTVLANEQVIDGRCERCGHQVVVKQLEQWFYRITDYAQRLLDDMELLESWPQRVITMQRNWIGRSEGAEVTFRCEDPPLDFPVFTTRPDTLFGATFFVMAPEHPDLEQLVAGTGHEQEVQDYVQQALTESVEQRADTDREKTGVFTGRYVVNPVNDERIPVYVSDYVLMEYGTGAIMAVPAHDQRDYEFARKFGLEIRRVVEPLEGDVPEDVAFDSHTGQERLVNSGRFDGLSSPEATRAIIDWLEKEGRGQRRGQLPAAGLAALAPALLGRADPDGLLRPRRPGAGARGPAAGAPARDRGLRAEGALTSGGERGVRQHDVPEVRWPGAAGDRHDGHVRGLVLVLPALLRRRQRQRAVGQRGGRAWMPVDQYIGGVEHAILHLMYARFFTKALATWTCCPSRSRSRTCSRRG